MSFQMLLIIILTKKKFKNNRLKKEKNTGISVFNNKSSLIYDE